MDGPMGEVDPDTVEQEIGNIWRNLYKLEKGFENIPTAKKISSRVRTLLDASISSTKISCPFPVSLTWSSEVNYS